MGALCRSGLKTARDIPRIGRRSAGRSALTGRPIAANVALAANYETHPITGSKVILISGLPFEIDQPENCQTDDLAAMCQRCHNTYDGPS